jgi:tetratricopeptide (TPR) repeat protein
MNSVSLRRARLICAAVWASVLVAALATVTGVLPTAGWAADGGREFASHLKASGLPALYLTELSRLCLEDGDLGACAECVDILSDQGRFDEAIRLADNLAPQTRDVDVAARMLKSYGLYAAGRYGDASGVLDTLVAMFPEPARLAEAVLLRSRCQFGLGSDDEALLNLRRIEPYLGDALRPGYLLQLAEAEESAGDLDRALKLYQDAWKKGVGAAGLGLMRCHLRQGRVDACLAVAKDATKRNLALPSREACGLAVAFGDVLPGLWHALMKHVIADSAFATEDGPGILASITRLAENGEKVDEACAALLARTRDEGERQRLRYARAVACGEPARAADSLAALLPIADDPELGIRCFSALVGLAPERKADAVRNLGPGVREAWGRVAPDERLALLGLLIDVAPDLVAPGTEDLLADLKPGLDDQALGEIAALLERAGETETAIAVYESVAQSPLISRTTLACDRQSHLLRLLARPDVDIAKEIEKIAKKDASDLELGDFFMEKLRDYGRASTYYARAIEARPKGIDVDATSLKLARALALASYGPPDTSGAVAAAPDERRSEALGILAAVAGSKSVSPDAVILATKMASGWLSGEPARVAEIAGTIGQRQDITASSLAAAAGLVSFLFIDGQGNYYERCSTLLGKVAADFGGSKQAPLAAFTLGRAKFAAGDYPGALEAFRACAGKSRDPVLIDLCKSGIGDCYLYSGGLAEAIEYLKQGKSPETVYRAGRCYELVGLADSSLACYRSALAACAPAALAARARLRTALVHAYLGAGAVALEAVDSPVSEIRERLRDWRAPVAAYALGRGGYAVFGAEVLKQAGTARMDVTCELNLLAAALLESGDPAGAYATLAVANPEAGNIFEEYSLTLNLARYACSAADARACGEERQRFKTRFTLDAASLAEIDLRRALALLDASSEGPSRASSSASVDSLVAAGNRHPLITRVFYDRGVGLIIDGNYPGARDVFGEIVRTWPTSDLYRDACFKLGSVYYLMKMYDSSGTYFGLAALSEKPSLVRDALFNRGLALEEAGGLSAAAEAYGALAVRFPLSEHFGRAITRCGFCLQSLGRSADAAAWYAGALRYAAGSEAQAETRYWIAEATAESGDHRRAACEFLRTAYLYPKEEAWAGTAAFNAGAECEAAGLRDHAVTIYRQNVNRFGKASDWGKASAERLAELLRASPKAE